MLRRLFASAAVGALLLAPSVATAQSCQTTIGNLVQNCSFELGRVVNGADYPNANVTGWTSLGNSNTGTFERWTNSFDGFAAQDGNSHLELQVNAPTAIEQILGTTAGTTYTLNFWAAHRPRDTNGFSQIDVYLDNVFLTSSGPITSAYQWNNVSQTFVASGANTTLQFRSMGNQTSYGDFLDNVSVVGQQRVIESTVPEPSSFALLGAGVMFVGFMARRRRQG
jgi:hypothetical protein